MKQQTKWILMLILLLGLTALACGSFLGSGDEAADGTGETAVTTNADSPAPAEVSEAESVDNNSPDAPAPPEDTTVVEVDGDEAENDEGETAVSDDTPATFTLNADNQYGEPAGVDSYRTSLEFRFTATGADGSQIVGDIMGEGARVVDPHAMTLNFTASGVTDFGGGQDFAFTQIGTTDYFILPDGQCASLSADADADNPYSILLDAGGMLGDLEGAALVEQDVTINGVLSDHYQFDQTHLDPSDPTTGDVIEAEGHLYVANEAGYVVRLVINGRGYSSLLSGYENVEGDIFYELNYYDFDQPLEITPPPGCAAAAETKYPVLDDAVNVNAVSGLFTYETAQSFDDVLAFYKTEMGAAGMALTQEFVQPPNASLTFTGNGSTVQINIAPSATAGGILVAMVTLP